jgi:transcription elongation factor/antiterminator RfaH
MTGICGSSECAPVKTMLAAESGDTFGSTAAHVGRKGRAHAGLERQFDWSDRDDLLRPNGDRCEWKKETMVGIEPRESGKVGCKRWYVAYTLPRREATAGFHLERQGFCVFLPRQKKTVRHARKFRLVDAPVFPRYLFVSFDPDRDRWRSINGTLGVARLILADERPVAVPTGVVETLVRSTGTDGLLRYREDLAPGQKVRLLAGPFADRLGILARLDDAGRVDVLLELMGRAVSVRLARGSVEPAA